MGTGTDKPTDKPTDKTPTFEQFVANRIAPPNRCQALVMVQGIVTKNPAKKSIEVAGIEFTQPEERIAALLETATDGGRAIASYWPKEGGEPESLMSLKEGINFKELTAPVMILRGYARGREGDQNIAVMVQFRRGEIRGEKRFEVMLARPLAKSPHPREMSEFRAVYMKGRWIATQVPMKQPPPRPDGPPRGRGGPPRGPRPGGPPRRFGGPPRGPRPGGPPRY